MARKATRRHAKTTAKANHPAATRRQALALGGIAGLAIAGGALALTLSRCANQSSADADADANADEKSRATTTPEEPTVTDDAAKTESPSASVALLARMTLEQKVAQLFFVTPEDVFPANPVTTASNASREAYAAYPVGGIAYFAKNLEDPEQTRTMLANVRQFGLDTVGSAPFLAVDEEGGTVARVASNGAFGIDNVGDMSNIGAAGDPTKAADVAATIAAYLADLGFNVDFAPVADIASNPNSSTMRRRSFGTTADVVAPMVKAAVEAFNAAGVGCTPKHFPGIGAAEGDSETELIYSTKTVDQMAEEELLPFAAAVEAGAPLVMVGHLACPTVNGDNTPASLSKTIVTDVLRGRMGFEHIAITDALRMGAIGNDYPAATLGVMALQAGNDMILMPADFGTTYQGVLDSVADGTLSEARIDESVLRILSVKERLGLLS